jgi:hypothetical protein
MRTISTTFLVLGVLAAAVCREPDERNGGDKGKARKPKFTVSEKTTYVTGPLDKDGYVDYVAALNERLGKGVTPKNNANALLWKALGPRPEGGKMPRAFFKLMGIEEPPEKGEYLVDLAKYAKGNANVDPTGKRLDELYKQQEQALSRPWTAKEYPDIAAWLKANDKPLAVVAEAVKRPRYFNPLVPSGTDKGAAGLIAVLLPAVQKCRELASALTARAMLRAGEGKLDDAWQDLLACHRLGRLTAQGGTIIEGLVGIAIDQIASGASLTFLAHAKLDSKRALACLRDLRELPPLPPMADKVDLAERFMFLDTVMMIDRHGTKYLTGLANGGPGIKPDPRAEEVLKNIDWDPALRNGNRWYDRMAAAMRARDRATREKQLDKIEEELKELKKKADDPEDLPGLLFGEEERPEVGGEKLGNVLISLLVPAVRKMQTAGDRAEQTQRNLHVAFALAAYRADHKRYPKELAALAPKYLKEVPGDFFSGKALIYRPAEDGYLLYSVGANGQDEGGRYYDDMPRGDDPRVRMPPPKK